MADKEILIEIKVDNEAAQKAVTQLTSDIEGNKKATKDLEVENKRLAKSGKQNTKQYKQNAELIAINKAELSTLTRERKRAIKTSQAEKGTLTALRNERAKLTEQRNRDLVVGSQEFDAQNLRIKGLTEEIKAGEEAGDNFTSSVGKYQNALQGAGGAISKISPALGGMTQGIISATKAGLAFIATPIGLVLAAIALALKTVQLFFTRTEEGGDDLAVAMAFLSGVFEGLLDVLTIIGKIIIDQVVAGFEQAALKFEILSAQVERGSLQMNLALTKLTGTAEEVNRVQILLAKNTLKTVQAEGKLRIALLESNQELNKQTKELKTASGEIITKAQANARLQETENELNRTIRANTVAEAERRQEIQKNLLITRDFTESFEDRKKALQEATKTELEQLKASEQIAQSQFDLARERDDLFASTGGALDEVAEAEANLINVRTDSFKRQRELQNRVTEQQNRENAEQKRIQDQKKKDAEQDADLAQDKADSEFRLSIAKKEIAADEIDDAQDKAFALTAIEKLRLANQLEDETLLKADIKLLELESDQTIKQIRENAAASQKKTADGITANNIKNAKKEITLQKQVAAAKASLLNSGFALAKAIAGKDEKLQKAIAIGQAITNTALGITKAFATLPFPAAVPASVAIAATGAAQLITIANSGSGSAATATTTTPTSVTEPQADTSNADSAFNQQQALEAAIANLGLTVSVTEINNAQSNVEVSESNSSIGG